MARATGQLERSLASLTIGMARKTAAKQQQAVKDGEFLQTVQVKVSGQADKTWLHVDKDVTWPLPFLYAPEQRRVSHPTPHWCGGGVVFEDPPGKLVVVQPMILSWNVTTKNWYIGAKLRFAATCPQAADGELISWSGVAHLTFQGYASFPEGETA